MKFRAFSTRSTAAALALVALPSCARSCKEDHPYVPYSIASTPANASSAGASTSTVPMPSSLPPATAFKPIRSEKTPANATKITVDGSVIDAPAGFCFESILRADYDTDNDTDVLAFLRNLENGGGSLALYTANPPGKLGAGKIVAILPAGAVGRPGCKASVDLLQVGPHTAQVVSDPSCADGGPPSSRWIGVVMPARDPALRIELQMGAIARGENFEVGVDASDRDGDLYDDVSISFNLNGAISPFEADGTLSSAIELRYFDRPSGLSRDPAEPSSSLKNEAQKVTRMAKKKGALTATIAASRRLRHLYKALCTEASSPIVAVSSASISCGGLAPIEEAALAEIDAALRIGEIGIAFAVLARMEADSGGGSRNIDEARKRIEKIVPLVNAEVTEVPLAVQPSPVDSGAWGSLAFASDNALLVRTATGTQRFDTQSKAITAMIDDAGAWAAEASSPDGVRRVAHVNDPCDGSVMHAQIAVADRLDEVLLPVDSLLGRACSKGNTVTNWRVSSWGKLGVELLVQGNSVMIPADGSKARITPALSLQPFQPGSPRSPDGRWLVMPSSLGLAAIAIGDRTRIWKASGVTDHALQLRDCAISKEASFVACVDGGKLVLMSGVRR